MIGKKALALLSVPPPALPSITATDTYGSIMAVRVVNSIIGEFWYCLTDSEEFEPGDGLSVYRPSEIKALAGKNYKPVALQTIDEVKTIFNGTVHR